jgi:dTDP-4-dehydrorhamnose 3,5-epimerase
VRFIATPLAGVTVVELEPREDNRGFFARVFSVDEFAEHGLNPRVVQANLSHNRRRGTVRGLHYQLPPFSEAKLIRCIQGAAFVVAVDLRPDSSTRLSYTALELRQGDQRSLYIPEGCAAGMQTLEDETELLYHVSEFYTPEVERGVRYDDPALGIAWPLPLTTISDKDSAWPHLDSASSES